VAPSLKAAARDLHAFSAARGYRPIPLSYSAADVPSLRQLTAQYLTCGPDADASIDLLGLNIFQDCSQSAWRTLHTQFRDLPIPVVISEAGCRTSSSGNRNRNFTDVALILSPEYQDVFSGISVFEWGMTENRYGIVEYADESHQGEPQPLPQFETLSSVLGAATPTGTPQASYTPSNVAPACPTSDAAKGWLVDESAALPTLAGLQMGTVTVSATVTNAGFPGSSGTGGAGQETVQVEGDFGGEADGLTTGAIAGITVGCVVGMLALVTGVLMCLGRRRRGAAHQSPERQVDDEPPPSYISPRYEVELPAQCMVVEMDGSPHSAASWRPMWKIPMRGGRQDSPTVTELPVGKWRRTMHYELEDSHLARADDGMQTGTWKVSPLSPGGGFV
jgi:1,3-beta-glucanosyltransferase GAS1